MKTKVLFIEGLNREITFHIGQNKNENFENRTNSDYYITFILSLVWLFGLYFYLEKSELDSEKIDRLQNSESIYYICLPDFIQKQFNKQNTREYS